MVNEDYSVGVYVDMMQPRSLVFSTIVIQGQAPMTVACHIAEIKGKFHFVTFSDPNEAIADLYYSLDEDLRGPWRLHIADDRVPESHFDAGAKSLRFIRGVWYGYNQHKNVAVISLPSTQREKLNAGTVQGSRSVLVTPQPQRGQQTLSRGLQK